MQNTETAKLHHWNVEFYCAIRLFLIRQKRIISLPIETCFFHKRELRLKILYFCTFPKQVNKHFSKNKIHIFWLSSAFETYLCLRLCRARIDQWHGGDSFWRSLEASNSIHFLDDGFHTREAQLHQMLYGIPWQNVLLNCSSLWMKCIPLRCVSGASRICCHQQAFSWATEERALVKLKTSWMLITGIVSFGYGVISPRPVLSLLRS